MRLQDWLPILTFVLGSLFSIVSETIRNRYERDREREARQSEQAALRKREQQDFTTKTLIELQDSLFELMSRIQASITANDQQPAEAKNKRAEYEIRARILVVRVQDDSLREAVELVLARLMTMGNISQPDERRVAWNEAATHFKEANNRIGYLLQEIY